MDDHRVAKRMWITRAADNPLIADVSMSIAKMYLLFLQSVLVTISWLLSPVNEIMTAALMIGPVC